MALHKKPSFSGVKWLCSLDVKWAQEYFRKPQSAAASEMQLQTLGESYTSILCSDAEEFSGPELISDSQKDSENVCCAQMSPHFTLFLGKFDFQFSIPKTKVNVLDLYLVSLVSSQIGQKMYLQNFNNQYPQFLNN